MCLYMIRCAVGVREETNQPERGSCTRERDEGLNACSLFATGQANKLSLDADHMAADFSVSWLGHRNTTQRATTFYLRAHVEMARKEGGGGGLVFS